MKKTLVGIIAYISGFILGVGTMLALFTWERT